MLLYKQIYRTKDFLCFLLTLPAAKLSPAYEMNFVQTNNMKLLLLNKQMATLNPSTNIQHNPSTNEKFYPSTNMKFYPSANMQITLLVFPSLMDSLTSSSVCSH